MKPHEIRTIFDYNYWAFERVWESICRALNRFESVGIVKSELQQSNTGPQRRYYRLTTTGIALLTEFTRRNIQVFETPSVSERITTVLQDSSQAQ